MGSWEYRPAEATFTVSDGFRRVFGLANDFVVAGLDGFLELVHPEDRERVRSTIAEATNGRLTPEVEYHIIRSDGVERRMHGRRELVREGATVVAVRAVTQDVTENRQLEAEPQRLLEQLEVLARTDALTGLRNRRGWGARTSALSPGARHCQPGNAVRLVEERSAGCIGDSLDNSRVDSRVGDHREVAHGRW